MEWDKMGQPLNLKSFFRAPNKVSLMTTSSPLYIQLQNYLCSEMFQVGLDET